MRKILAANTLSQVITIGIQLASVPVYLSSWTLEQYGIWLLMISFPSYLAFADFGVTAAAANRLTGAVARSDLDHAAVVYSAAIFFGTGSILVVSVVAASLLAIGWPLLPAAIQGELLALNMILLWTSLLIFSTVPNIVLQATERTHVAIYISNATRLLEFVASAVVLSISPSYVAVAIALIAARVVGIATSFQIGNAPKYQILSKWNWEVIECVRELWRPAVGYMAMPVQQAISFQGFAIVVGTVLGPTTLAIFNSYRTLARAITQGASVFGNSAIQQLTIYFSTSRVKQADELYRRWMRILLSVCVLAMIGSAVLFQFVLEEWTHGKAPYDMTLSLLLILSSALSGLTSLPRAVLLASNTLYTPMIQQVALSGACLVMALVATSVWPSIYSVAGIGILLECALLANNALHARRELSLNH